MLNALKTLLRQPYWVIALILGVMLLVLPDVRDPRLAIQAQSARVLVMVGIGLLGVSVLAFGFTVWTKHRTDESVSDGLDFTRVKEGKGVMWTTVSGCEIRVIDGRLEEYDPAPGTAVVLPCNEYFDDECAGDTKSALGAYVNRVFEGQVNAFVTLVKNECKNKLGAGVVQQKTEGERAESFGVGRCVLLLKPLNRSVPLALVSTTTQRAGQGLAAQISYLFHGMRELVARLADARLTEAVMPIMGAGHGRIDTPLAFVGLLLAIAEAARYGQGSQRLRRVTIIVFKRDRNAAPQVSRVVVRRALALIGSQD